MNNAWRIVVFTVGIVVLLVAGGVVVAAAVIAYLSVYGLSVP